MNSVDNVPTKSGMDVAKLRYILGLCCCACVVVLWVLSSYLVQEIYDRGYSKPLIISYASTNVFFCYLPLYYLFHYLYDKWQTHKQNKLATNASEDVTYSFSSTRPTTMLIHPEVRPLKVHLKYALYFAPLWVAMNLTFNLALSLSSMTSCTVLSSTSGLFVVILSVVFLKKPCFGYHILGACCTIAGAALISFINASSDDNNNSIVGNMISIISAIMYSVYSISLDYYSGDPTPVTVEVPPSIYSTSQYDAEEVSSLSPSGAGTTTTTTSTTESASAASLLSFTFTATKSDDFDTTNPIRRTYEQEQAFYKTEQAKLPPILNVTLLFGCMGLVNMILLWPIMLVAHGAGWESLEAPPSSIFGLLLIAAFLGTGLSDFLWAHSVVLTSPLVATIATSFTIPSSMVVDLTVNGLKFSPWFILGAVFVFTGFILANLSPKPVPEDKELDEHIPLKASTSEDSTNIVFTTTHSPIASLADNELSTLDTTHTLNA